MTLDTTREISSDESFLTRNLWRIFAGRSSSKSEISGCSSSSSRENRQQKEEEGEGKDLRALIGLELVVDYVKEPKEDPNIDEEQSPDVGE